MWLESNENEKDNGDEDIDLLEVVNVERVVKEAATWTGRVKDKLRLCAVLGQI